MESELKHDLNKYTLKNKLSDLKWDEIYKELKPKYNNL